MKSPKSSEKCLNHSNQETETIMNHSILQRLELTQSLNSPNADEDIL